VTACDLEKSFSFDSQSQLKVTASCADNWAETKPTLPDGTRPGLAVITEGELRRQNAAGAPAARPLTDYVLTTRKQRRLPPWLDLGVRGAPPFAAAAESRRHAPTRWRTSVELSRASVTAWKRTT